MGKAPAFQFYANDFLQGTSDFTLEERGAYVVLLCRSWDKGPLPNDLGRIAVMLGVTGPKARKLWAVIAGKWTLTDDGYVNLKLEQVRAERDRYGATQADRAAKGWDKRRKYAGAHAAADAGAMPGACTSDFRLPRTTPHKEREGDEKAPTTALLRLFDELHRQKLGTPAVFSSGKDAALMARLWKQRKGQTPDTEALIRAFFASRDGFLQKAGHSVGVFTSQVPKLLTHTAFGENTSEAAFERVMRGEPRIQS